MLKFQSNFVEALTGSIKGREALAGDTHVTPHFLFTAKDIGT